MPSRACKYITEKEFEDFNHNFRTLIDTFNHSMTDVKDDVRGLKKHAESTDKAVNKISIEIAKFSGAMSVNVKVLWWLVGIFTTLIGALLIGAAIK